MAEQVYKQVIQTKANECNGKKFNEVNMGILPACLERPMQVEKKIKDHCAGKTYTVGNIFIQLQLLF